MKCNKKQQTTPIPYNLGKISVCVIKKKRCKSKIVFIQVSGVVWVHVRMF